MLATRSVLKTVAQSTILNISAHKDIDSFFCRPCRFQKHHFRSCIRRYVKKNKRPARRDDKRLFNRHFNATRKTQEQCAAAESELLRQQRKLRPVSPHLTIYQPQITWYLSGAHRITGVAVGGGNTNQQSR